MGTNIRPVLYYRILGARTLILKIWTFTVDHFTVACGPQTENGLHRVQWRSQPYTLVPLCKSQSITITASIKYLHTVVYGRGRFERKS